MLQLERIAAEGGPRATSLRMHQIGISQSRHQGLWTVSQPKTPTTRIQVQAMSAHLAPRKCSSKVSVRSRPSSLVFKESALSARVRAAMVCTNDDSAHHEETPSQYRPAAWAREAATLRPGV